MPYHAGSRPPLDLAAGSGAITGMSLATTAVEILAATLEAVCYRLAAGTRRWRPPCRGAQVVASGGAIVASLVAADPGRRARPPGPGGRRAGGLGQGRPCWPSA